MLAAGRRGGGATGLMSACQRHINLLALPLSLSRKAEEMKRVCVCVRACVRARACHLSHTCRSSCRHYGAEAETSHVEPAHLAAARAQQEHAEGNTLTLTHTHSQVFNWVRVVLFFFFGGGGVVGLLSGPCLD